MTTRFIVATLALCLCVAGTTFAQTPALQADASPNNYALDAAWLCKPGRKDACSVDLTTTIVKADGSFSQERGTANSDAPIDCFYVYPTVSTDPTPFSDMVADPAELNVKAPTQTPNQHGNPSSDHSKWCRRQRACADGMDRRRTSR
jgi:hypothetical protein